MNFFLIMRKKKIPGFKDGQNSSKMYLNFLMMFCSKRIVRYTTFENTIFF